MTDKNPPQDLDLDAWAAYLQEAATHKSVGHLADDLGLLVDMVRESESLDAHLEGNTNYPFLMLGNAPLLSVSPEVRTILSEYGDSLIERDFAESGKISVNSDSNRPSHQTLTIQLEVTTRPPVEWMVSDEFEDDEDEEDDGGGDPVIDGDPDTDIPDVRISRDEDTI